MEKLKLLMIGDSITDWFNTKRLLPNFDVKNVGVAADSTTETLERIENSWFENNPDHIFICIGTNDIFFGKTDSQLLENIRLIIEKIRKHYSDGKIYLTSLFPTYYDKLRPNERILTVNAELIKKARELELSFFDLHYHFTDESGNLKEEYAKDEVHLTRKAYEKWAELLTLFLKK